MISILLELRGKNAIYTKFGTCEAIIRFKKRRLEKERFGILDF